MQVIFISIISELSDRQICGKYGVNNSYAGLLFRKLCDMHNSKGCIIPTKINLLGVASENCEWRAICLANGPVHARGALRGALRGNHVARFTPFARAPLSRNSPSSRFVPFHVTSAEKKAKKRKKRRKKKSPSEKRGEKEKRNRTVTIPPQR